MASPQVSTTSMEHCDSGVFDSIHVSVKLAANLNCRTDKNLTVGLVCLTMSMGIYMLETVRIN